MASSESTIRFAALKFPDKEPFSSYRSENEETSLEGLSVVNLFIGANNFGKSRFLRFLFSTLDIPYTTNMYDLRTFLKLVEEISSAFEGLFPRDVVSVAGLKKGAFTILRDSNTEGEPFIRTSNPLHAGLRQFLEKMVGMKTGGLTYTRSFVEPPDGGARIRKAIRQLGAEYMEKFNAIPWDPSIFHRKRFYIPILRGMRPTVGEAKDTYQDRTIKDYFTEKGQVKLGDNQCVFTGLELYKKLKQFLLGQPEEREAVREFEKFLSEWFFDQNPVTLIPYEGDDTVHIRIGREPQLPIYNLGDGLQNLIILTFNVFLEKNPCVFFIEEPETCMHPGFQRIFLQALVHHGQHQYFLTTHSNHFLDMTLDFSDISVYLFTKNIDSGESTFTIDLSSSKDAVLLRELGVQNSSVFLTNATVWMEGITDRLYLRAFMEKFLESLERSDSERAATLRRFKEDIHYSFVEYQGSNIEHWSFESTGGKDKRMAAQYLCASAFVLADGDVAGKGDRLERLSGMLGDKLCVLECKEIENLIPQEVIRAVVKDVFDQQGKDLSVIKYGYYSKSSRGLGYHLDRKLDKPVFASSTGTLKSKMRFCEAAVALMNDPDFKWRLTRPVEALCESIFRHIEQCNQ